MWKWSDEIGWWFDGYTDIYFIQKRILEYPVSMHNEKLNMSITEAAIATRQRIDRDDYNDRRKIEKHKGLS